MFTINDLRKAFETEDGIREDTVELTVAGAEVYIDACLYGGEKTVEEVEYFLLGCSRIHLIGGDAESVVDTLSKLDSEIKESDDDKIRLKVYFDEHQQKGWSDDAWGFYSDWHKDLYGYRPHGAVCGEYVNPHDPYAVKAAPSINWADN